MFQFEHSSHFFLHLDFLISENAKLPLWKNMPVKNVDQEPERHEFQKSPGDVWIPLVSFPPKPLTSVI